MLGHADLKTTQIYAKVVEKKISDDMFKLEEKLSKNRSKKQRRKKTKRRKKVSLKSQKNDNLN